LQRLPGNGYPGSQKSQAFLAFPKSFHAAGTDAGGTNDAGSDAGSGSRLLGRLPLVAEDPSLSGSASPLADVRPEYPKAAAAAAAAAAAVVVVRRAIALWTVVVPLVVLVSMILLGGESHGTAGFARLDRR